MASMNTVNLIGRVVRDIEPKVTQSGKAVCGFTLAVDGFKPKDKDEAPTNWIPCVAWGKLVDILVKYAPKGKQIGITGRLQTRTYENDEGQKRTVMEVVVDNMQLLGGGEAKVEKAPLPTDSDAPDSNNADEIVNDDNWADEPIDLSDIPF